MSLGAIFSGFNGPARSAGPMTVLRAVASVPHDSMSDKSAEPKKPRKTAKAQPSVLGSLPSTRHDPLGRRGSAATAKRTSAKRSATARPTAKPKAAANPKPKAAANPKPKPAPVRPAPPPPPPPQSERRRPPGPPSGSELVTTAIQAVGEIAQIGVTVGGQVLRRAARRLPRP
jgi:hypothetical protein